MRKSRHSQGNSYHDSGRSSAHGLDHGGKDSESMGDFYNAAIKRNEAAKRFEEEGRTHLAKQSYDRAAKDSHEELRQLNFFVGPAIGTKIREMRKLNYEANLAAGRLYYASGIPEDIVQAAFAWGSAAHTGEKLREPNSRELANMALDIFDQYPAAHVPGKLIIELERISKMENVA